MTYPESAVTERMSLKALLASWASTSQVQQAALVSCELWLQVSMTVGQTGEQTSSDSLALQDRRRSHTEAGPLHPLGAGAGHPQQAGP